MTAGEAAPRIRPWRLAPAGSLSGDFVRGMERARALLDPPTGRIDGGAEDHGYLRPADLEADAFGTTGAAASRRLERILAGGGKFVSTGQQPVLFLGPLYVLYKALTAIRVAREVESETGDPTLALFWIASDDHDWAEVGATRLPDRENRLRELRLDPPPGREGRPVGPSRMGPAVEHLTEELPQLLPESDFLPRYLALFRDAYRGDGTMAGAFASALSGVLGDRPLAWIDAAGPAVKRASVPLLRRALTSPAEGEEALREGARRVRAAGYEATIPVLKGASHVFVDTSNGRERVYVEGGRARLGRGGERRDVEELLRKLEEEPERFSPNVALRPVLESWLLPVARAILGPGEIAYWAELAPLFARHGVEIPRVEPRHGWMVVEAKVAKVLEKLQAGVEEFADGGDSLRRSVIERGRPPEVARTLTALRRAIQEATGRVEDATAEELPGIRASVGKAKSQLMAAVDELERSVDQRVEERQKVVLDQIDKATLHLFPDGDPQERVVNPLYYLSRYGDRFVEAVAAATRERAEAPEARR